jgi:hypothetical protein
MTRPRPPLQAIKMGILSLSLAATLGGWVALIRQERPEATTWSSEEPPSAPALSLELPPTAPDLVRLPPIPTLVPTPVPLPPVVPETVAQGEFVLPPIPSLTVPAPVPPGQPSIGRQTAPSLRRQAVPLRQPFARTRSSR